jgi:hypothetical protein
MVQHQYGRTFTTQETRQNEATCLNIKHDIDSTSVTCIFLSMIIVIAAGVIVNVLSWRRSKERGIAIIMYIVWGFCNFFMISSPKAMLAIDLLVFLFFCILPMIELSKRMLKYFNCVFIEFKKKNERKQAEEIAKRNEIKESHNKLIEDVLKDIGD